MVAAARARSVVRCHGAAVERLTGKSPSRQFLEQVATAIQYRIAPVYYYVFELYLPEQRRLAPHYLMRYETKEIAYRLLYPIATAGYRPTPLKNKLEFARHCRANGVRRVDVYMLFEDGRRAGAADMMEQLPQADLFVKPVLGKGGGGAELWRYAGGGSYRSSRGDECDAAGLISHVADLSRAEPFIIQQAVRNHRDLLDLGGGALSTVRMLSCRNEAGTMKSPARHSGCRSIPPLPLTIFTQVAWPPPLTSPPACSARRPASVGHPTAGGTTGILSPAARLRVDGSRCGRRPWIWPSRPTAASPTMW